MGNPGHRAGNITRVHHDALLPIAVCRFCGHEWPISWRHKKTFSSGVDEKVRVVGRLVPCIMIMSSLPTSQDER